MRHVSRRKRQSTAVLQKLARTERGVPETQPELEPASELILLQKRAGEAVDSVAEEAEGR